MLPQPTPVPIVCLDPIVHTTDNPFCGDETCPCMEELYDLVEAEIYIKETLAADIASGFLVFDEEV